MIAFQILKRAHSRGFYYSRADMIRAIEQAGLAYREELVYFEVPIRTIEERKRLEYQMSLIPVARRIQYRIVQK